MTNFHIKNAENLVAQLNNQYNKDVKISFEEENGNFSYNLLENIINCNPTFFKSKDYTSLYNDYYIDAILHEYGHAYYSTFLRICVAKFYLSDSATNYYKKSAFEEQIRFIKNTVNTPTYIDLLFDSCSEVFADYFLIKNHYNFNPCKNIDLFLKWRVKKIIESYENTIKHNLAHFSLPQFNIYYPIPSLINIMKNNSTSEIQLFTSNIDKYHKFLELFKDQLYNTKDIFLKKETEMYEEFKSSLNNLCVNKTLQEN